MSRTGRTRGGQKRPSHTAPIQTLGDGLASGLVMFVAVILSVLMVWMRAADAITLKVNPSLIVFTGRTAAFFQGEFQPRWPEFGTRAAAGDLWLCRGH